MICQLLRAFLPCVTHAAVHNWLGEIPELVRGDSAIQHESPTREAASSSRIILDAEKKKVLPKARGHRNSKLDIQCIAVTRRSFPWTSTSLIITHCEDLQKSPGNPHLKLCITVDSSAAIIS